MKSLLDFCALPMTGNRLQQLFFRFGAKAFDISNLACFGRSLEFGN